MRLYADVILKGLKVRGLAKKTKDYLLVDGYNIIFAWDNLNAITVQSSLDHARQILIDALSDYGVYTDQNIIIVFDAHKVTDGKEFSQAYNNTVTVVYTKEKETADTYIERTSKTLVKNYTVKVATSDSIEQIIIIGQGATRMSAKSLKTEVDLNKQKIKDIIEKRPIKTNMLIDNVDKKTAEWLEKMRLGKRK